MPRFIIPCLAIVALALAACGYGDDNTPRPTNTFAPAATSTPSTSGVREFGDAPVFWRTIDEFKTLRAREPYFVVIRVTGGYSEPTLRVRAEKKDGSVEPIAFDVVGATPTGSDAEGAYFPTNITLPSPGAWTLIVDTGTQEVTLDVTAMP